MLLFGFFGAASQDRLSFVFFICLAYRKAFWVHSGLRLIDFESISLVNHMYGAIFLSVCGPYATNPPPPSLLRAPQQVGA